MRLGGRLAGAIEVLDDIEARRRPVADALKDWGLAHRFAGSGPLGGHAMGNLLIVALWELLGDTVEGLDVVRRLLGARGRVLPMAATFLSRRTVLSAR